MNKFVSNLNKYVGNSIVYHPCSGALQLPTRQLLIALAIPQTSHKHLQKKMARLNRLACAAALIALFLSAAAVTSSHATIYQDRNAVHQLEAFSYGIISTVAGSITNKGSSETGIAATAAKLTKPAVIAMDASGNLFITDLYRIVKVTASTGFISTIAGTGFKGFSGDGREAIYASIGAPEGIELDKDGNIFFSDYDYHRIRKITVSTGIISTVAGNGDNLYDKDNVAATRTTLSSPIGVVLDADGNIYIADTYNNRIRKVTASTGIITTVAGDGKETTAITGSSVIATAASVKKPTSIALDKSGNIYIAVWGASMIYKVTVSTGRMTHVAGGQGFGGYATLPLETTMSPSYLAFDKAGNLFIVESGNDYIRKWNVTTNLITIVAGSGGSSTSDTDNDGRRSTMAALYYPKGIVADRTVFGNFYFCDSGHNTVRKVTYADAEPSTAATLGPSASPVPSSSVAPTPGASSPSSSSSSPSATPASSSPVAPTPTATSPSASSPSSKTPTTPSSTGSQTSDTSRVAGPLHMAIAVLSSLLFLHLRRDA